MTIDISPTAIPPRIELALRQASRETGADFDYLLDTAIRESGLKSNAQSRSSSATGLFQFIENTWLGMMKTAGAALGFGELADKIEQGPDGRYKVADRKARQEILALRKDPQAAALMAGAYARESEKALSSQLGREPSHGELYIAHFLGKAGASRLLAAARETPEASAAELFPKAAAANRSIFYDKSGQARTVAQVREHLIASHDNGPVRLAGAEINERPAMPVIAPAAAAFLKPANFAARQGDGRSTWDHSLFTGSGRTSGARPAKGPMVLDSARLVALIEENLDHGPIPAGERPADTPAQGSAKRRAPGLLEGRRPFLDLFRSG